jgi:hypothetical protein
VPLVHIVIVLSLLQFFWFGVQVGQARVRFGVPAPAISGNPDFERVFRVEANTLEQLVIFLPGIWMFASYLSPRWAAGLGIVYLIGRFVYARGYARAANQRGLGFGLSALPVLILLIGGLVGAVLALIRP